jgi:hydrogenase-4 component F
MGAGVFAIKFGSKKISAHRGAMDVLPWTGPLFLLAVLALCAMPPFGIFRSEFQIVAGGLDAHGYAVAAILIVLITLAFLGLSASATGIVFRPRPAEGDTVTSLSVMVIPAPGREGDGGDRADGGPVATLTRAEAPPAPRRGEPSSWMVVPMVAGVIALLILGLHPPGELTELITRAVAQLRGAA